MLSKTIKVFIGTCLLLFVISCGQTENQNKTISHIKCTKTISFENAVICLPEINGMTECLDDDKIKNNLINYGADYNPNFTNIALYLENNFYENPRLHYGELLDDYFIMYTEKDILDRSKEITFKNFTEVIKQYKASNTEMLVKWDDVKSYVNNKSKILTLGESIMIKSYSLNDKIVSTVLLFQNEFNKKITYYITISNIIWIKNHIICFNYKKKYTNEKSITEAQSKNDFYSLMLLQNN